MQYKHIEGDVVVVGGAITGLRAAIRAKELAPDKEIVLVDKATAGNSGCANWAGGATCLVTPEDDLGEFMNHYLAGGEGIAYPDWLEMALVETYDRVRELDSWGVPFQKEEGAFYRRKGRGGGAYTALCRGKPMLNVMRQVAKRLGIKIVDKVMIVDLVKQKERFAGVLGFKIGRDEIAPYFFSAGAVVLVPGPCSFKASYIGHRMVTGDGIAAAFRHGADIMGMEFAVGHNTGPRAFDNSGMGRYGEMGARFVNNLGEEFMHKYDPELVNRATWNTLLYGMAKEVDEGRGPLFLDFSGISEGDYQLLRKINPHTFVAMERMGYKDLREEKLEFIPSLAGNRATGAGLRLDKNMATTLPGVFTGGDTGGKYHYGANAGYSGMNFGWCNVSGYRAGTSAVEWRREAGAGEFKPNQSSVEEALEFLLAPTRRSGGVTPDEVIGAVQDAIVPYRVLILKHEERLRKALEEIIRIKDSLDQLAAPESHSLMKAHEAQNMVLIAELIIRASLIRKETRGVHHRDDHPQRDDRNWQKWLYCRQGEHGAVEYWTEEGGSKSVKDRS